MSALARETTKVLWGKRLGAGILLLLMLAAAGCNFLWGGLAPSTPTDFRVTDGEFLDRVVSALAAVGGAVWTVNEEGGL